MDAKITLCFNEAVINKAKKFAEVNNISLSRLIEFLLQKITSSHYHQWRSFQFQIGFSKLLKAKPSTKHERKEHVEHQRKNFITQENKGFP